MSKKVIKHKTAKFTLEPDGFSIHTIELSMELTCREFYELKDHLYRQRETEKGNWIYPDGWGNHICTYYKDYGIRITLEHNSSENIGSFYVRMVVNPRKLIDPGASYIGILPPEESSVKKLRKAFAKLFKDTVLKMISIPINSHG